MRIRLPVLLLSVLFLVRPYVTVAAAALPQYRVSIAPSMDTLQVRACFPDTVPHALHAESASATELLAHADVGGRSIAVAGTRLPLTGLKPGDCVNYRVNLARAGPDAGQGGLLRGADWSLVGINLWLWRPREGDSRLELRVELPPGFAFSSPWPRNDAGTRFLVGKRPQDWYGRVAFGNMTRHALPLPGGTLDVALLGRDTAQHQGRLMTWISANAQAVTSITGRLPVPHAQVLVVPLGRSGDAVPWGQVMRGGGDGVHLFIDPSRPLTEFMNDWVLSHELSHLFHPTLELDARWLSEGLASYLQFVSRAHTGMISATAAWEELHAGFQRGRRGTRPGRSLAELSEHMMREGSSMRVYWSGAAVFLLADLELRRRSGGNQTLGQVLDRFRDCCLPAHDSWSGTRFMAELDRASDSRIFSALYRQWARSDRFPTLDAAYRDLGLRARNARSLISSDDPYARILRGLIMGPRSRP
ncbi:MAG: hypothetical protein ACPGU7_12955 [Gammaproteobacteria bacterium]